EPAAMTAEPAAAAESFEPAPPEPSASVSPPDEPFAAPAAVADPAGGESAVLHHDAPETDAATAGPDDAATDEAPAEQIASLDEGLARIDGLLAANTSRQETEESSEAPPAASQPLAPEPSVEPLFVEKPVPPVAPAVDEPVAASPAAGSVEESVDDYMTALLARMREARGEEPAPAPVPKPKPQPTATAPNPVASPASADLPQPAATATPQSAPPPIPAAEPAPLPPPPAMPRPRVDKEKLREEMRQLRAIANTSARSAMMEATWRKTRARLVMEVLVCMTSLALGLTLIVTDVWGSWLHYGVGGAVCAAAVWIARDFGRTLDLLRRQKAAAKKAAAEEEAIAARTAQAAAAGPPVRG
ncbi:MAG: hypothetical protein AAF907_16990, partial [Planctomycetota bacterium]